MPQRDGYVPGVPCWVDASEPDPEAALEFYGGLFDLGGKVIIPPFDAPWSTATYTIRVTVLGDPQGATFIASKFVPENKDLGS
jgi:hypothetical protein